MSDKSNQSPFHTIIKNGIEVVTLKDSGPYIMGFTRRHGGVSESPYESLNFGSDLISHKDNPLNIQENWKRFLESYQLQSKQLIRVEQTHSDEILHCEEYPNEFPDYVPVYDGMISNDPEKLLVTRYADCVPVLLFDRFCGIFATVHSGWRGTVKNIAGKAVAKMVHYGAGQIEGVIGPCICSKCFQIGAEVAEEFHNARLSSFVYQHNNHFYSDLKNAVAHQLQSAGVKNVYIAPECTFECSREWFSYRYSKGETGRLIGFITGR